MVALPTRYYVQRAQSYSAYTDLVPALRGWLTIVVTFNREEADAWAQSFEGGLIFEEGEDISDQTVVLSRVVTADELRSESEEALALAEAMTRVQLWQRLEEWASPLIAPDHAG